MPRPTRPPVPKPRFFNASSAQALAAGATSYAGAESAAAAALANPAQVVPQDLLGAINAPVLALTGRPLIGNGCRCLHQFGYCDHQRHSKPPEDHHNPVCASTTTMSRAPSP
ncbi:hypothetical protein NJB18091_33690 [Mycobacterium marinum]|nr:hypothetical protein NJB18091_33690 [Mycobacterium marinum]